MEAENKTYLGCATLQALLCLAPVAVVREERIYTLSITKSAAGYSVEYHFNDRSILVNPEGDLTAGRCIALFSTSRTDHDLYKALGKMLTLLHTERATLQFMPVIHPFNDLEDE